jgi:hypothetical protein
MTFILTVACLGLTSLANVQAQENQISLLNQVSELYKNGKYQAVVDTLDANQNFGSTLNQWHFYYGASLHYLSKHAKAVEHLKRYILSDEGALNSTAYFLLGKSQHELGDFNGAITSLELSLDLSLDPAQDRQSDDLIELSNQFLKFYESQKPTNISAFVGYNYDTNILDYSDSIFTKKLSGHVLNYGLSLSRRYILGKNYFSEPTFLVLDNYSQDDSFKSDEDLQANDNLQFLVSLPFIYFNFENKGLNRAEVSANFYSSYLPINSTQREQYLNSTFLQIKNNFTINPNLDLSFGLVAAFDKSMSDVDADDDASGSRYGLDLGFRQSLNKDNTALLYDLGYSQKYADGANQRFTRFNSSLGYDFYLKKWGVANVSLRYDKLNYPEQTTPRADNKYGISFQVNRQLTDSSSILMGISSNDNRSSVSTFEYSDFSVSIKYLKNWSF